MYLVLKQQRDYFAPAICFSSSYHLQSSISSLLLYVQDGFNTRAPPPLSVYQEAELQVHFFPMSLYDFSLPKRFPIDTRIARLLHLSLLTLKELYPDYVDYNSSSSCREALTYTRTLN